MTPEEIEYAFRHLEYTLRAFEADMPITQAKIKGEGTQFSMLAALRHEMAVMAKMIELIRESMSKGYFIGSASYAIDYWRKQAEAEMKGVMRNEIRHNQHDC